MRVVMIALALFALSVSAADRYAALRVGDKVYRDVVVRSATESSLIVLHRGGMAQIPLADVAPEVQAAYGYNAQADEERRQRLDKESLAVRQQVLGREAERMQSGASSPGDGLLALFGSAPELKQEVDLRPQFIDWGLGVRSQGSRPSCSIFALVGALEFENARSGRAVERYSEEYLIWATLKTLGRYDQQAARSSGALPPGIDAGFALQEVAQAIQTYGVLPRERMPYVSGNASWVPEPPSNEAIAYAQNRSKVTPYVVVGRTNEAKVQNIIHILNTNRPVVIGAAWPHYATISQTATLSGQKPVGSVGHAALLVGYRCPTGNLEDVTFIFRNSWGRKWGSGGYGFIRYQYLEQHLQSGVALGFSKS